MIKGSSSVVKALLYVAVLIGVSGCEKGSESSIQNIGETRTPDSEVVAPIQTKVAPVNLNLHDHLLNPIGLNPNTPSACSGRFVHRSGASQNNLSSIQAAIDSAIEGEQILVGPGDYNEVLNVSGKKKISIRSECGARISGIKVSGSSDILVEGFRIGGVGAAVSHLVLIGDESWGWKANLDDKSSEDEGSEKEESEGKPDVQRTNERITITGNSISGSGQYPALMIRGFSKDITIKNNYIFGNPSAGVVLFPNGDQESTYTIDSNIIYRNGLNGLMVKGNSKSRKYVITGNRILQNGLKAINSQDSYGLKVHAADEGAKGGTGAEKDKDQGEGKNKSKGVASKDSFIIKDNVISFNHGREQKEKSSKDIYRFDKLFNDTDSGNRTLTGMEGPSVTKIVDAEAPKIQFLRTGGFRTKEPPIRVLSAIFDDSPITTEIYRNGEKISSTASFHIDFDTTLIDGDNVFEIRVKDAFGNQASSALESIFLDRIAPKVLSTLPADGATLYTNKFPFYVDFLAQTDEPLSGHKINTIIADIDNDKLRANVAFGQEGSNAVNIEAVDLVGNVSTTVKNLNIVLDTVPPVVTIGMDDGLTFGKPSVPVMIHVQDTSPTTTELTVNGESFFFTRSIEFETVVNLTKEGENTLSVVSTDDAGNVSETKSIRIFRDLTPPVLTFVQPGPDSVVSSMQFDVQVNSNEKLSVADLNQSSMTISLDKMSALGTYVGNQDGSVTLKATATDLYGNTATESINVQILLNALNPNLIGIYLDEKNNKLIVKGANWASRPNLEVKVSGGFFDSQTVVSDRKGSFQASINLTSVVKVSAYDPILGKTVNAQLIFGDDADTILAGTVRDPNDKPLVGATVRIVGTSLVTKTNGNGLFSFSRSQYPNAMVTGDQQLSIDGSTIVSALDEVPRKFSTTVVAITIGIRQSNVLQTPIYLIPTLLDGSAQGVSIAEGGVVTNVNAPGAQLDIPAGATKFPSGVSADLISMTQIPAEFSTVPPVPEAMPKTVVALEPSGTTFTQPVELTLPNLNEFPPKTEMVIMLMNSKTGRWEVGGAATVSDNGSSVITKPGQGIRHFSLAYATIAGPNIRQIGAQDRPGADAFNGALSTKIELPSFKVLGKSVAPSLYYKSTWAKPNAVVTNLFDFPNKKTDVTLAKQYGASVEKYVIELKSCTWAATNTDYWCHKNPTDFYTNVQFENSYSGVTSQIQPEKVIASLRTGSLQTEKYEFKNIPHMANISFAVDLKDDSDQTKYLKSGIYPYQAHYDIHFKEIIMGTVETKYWNNVMDAQTSSPKEFSEEHPGLFTQDLTESILVQNYRDSAAGIGWRIGGVQKIVNPAGNKILVEEADGQISTYSIKNTISTVFDVGAQGGDVKRGIALNYWPHVAVGAKDSDTVLNLSFSESGISKSLIGTNYPIAGTMQGFDFYNYDTQSCWTERYCANRKSGWGWNVCVEWGERVHCTNHPNSYCSKHAYNYQLTASPSQMIHLGNRVIGADTARHSVFDLTANSAQRVLGAHEGMRTVSNFYQVQSDTHDTQVRQYCNSFTGLGCSSGTGSVQTFGAYNACGSGPVSTGEIPVKGDSFTNGMQSLNTPMGITSSPYPDVVVIADTGNHKVRWLNLATRETGVLVGNGQAMDLGDGGPGVQASISHPQGVAYDGEGNLYISTQSGFIRKLDFNGIISTIAGDPINGKLGHEVEAKSAFFNKPYGLVVDKTKNYLYVADTGHNRVVRIDLNADIASTVAGSGSPQFSGDGGSALEAGISAPTLLGLDDKMNLLIVDSGNNRVRRVIFQNTAGGVLAFTPTADDNSELVKESDGSFIRKYRTGATAVFDTDGSILEESDRIGRKITFIYDQARRLERIEFISGQSISYVYSGDKLSSVIDQVGRETKFDYDSYGNLRKVVFPDTSVKEYEYNSDSLMVAESNQQGGWTKYVYNAQSRIEKVVSPGGAESIINDLASQNLNNYDSSKVNVPKSSGSGEGQVADQIVDPNGNVSVVEKDFRGFISTIIDAKGQKTILKRDSKGRVVEARFPDNSTVKNTYNSYGDILRIEDVELGIVEEKDFNQWGQVISETSGSGQTLKREFDPVSGLLIKEIAPTGITTTYKYNNFGQVTEKSILGLDGAVHAEIFEYDQVGNLIRDISSNFKTVLFKYDGAGNVLESVQEAQDGNKVTSSYTYDLFNQLTKVKSPKGEITQYEYSANGQLTKIKDTSGKETTFEYSGAGNLIRKSDTFGKVSTYSHDKIGNLISETDPNGQIRYYKYDNLNKLTAIHFADDIISYQYNSRGELTEIGNNVSTVLYVRDSKNRIVEASTIGKGPMSHYPSINLKYGYDKNNNRVSLETEIGNFIYTYNDANQLEQLQNSWGDAFSFQYNGVGNLTGVLRPGGKSEYSYSGNIINKIIHSTDAVVKSFFEYQYDYRNYPVSQRTPAGGSDYTYDSNGQIISASGVINESFEYDSIGNRTKDKTGNFEYSAGGQQLLEDWQFNYLYDANGNLIQKLPKDKSKTAYVYTYSSKNELIQVQITDGVFGQVKKKINYIYDALGRRISKNVWDSENSFDPKKTYGKQYIYDGDNAFAEYDQDGKLLAKYTFSPLMPDDILAAEITDHGVNSGLSKVPGKFYYLKDILGSVSHIAGPDGNIVQSYAYGTFGNIKSITDSNNFDMISDPILNTTYTYTGREFDRETGLFYYRARYYDANIGRFLSKDPHPGNLRNPMSFVNAYSYVENRPTIATDPSGRFIFLALLAASWVGSSYMSAAVGVAVIGALGALATVEITKYGGNTSEMLKKESGWSLLGTAAFGALGGWLAARVGGYIQGMGMMKSLKYGALTSWIPSTVGYGVGTAVGSTAATGLMDATNIVNPSRQDYMEGFAFGLIFGGLVGASNYGLKTKLAYPMGVMGEGGYFYTTNSLPEKDLQK